MMEREDMRVRELVGTATLLDDEESGRRFDEDESTLATEPVWRSLGGEERISADSLMK